HHAGVFDVDLGARLVLQAANRLAAGSDDQPDLLGIDLDLDQPRGIGRDLLARALDRAEHGPENLEAGLVSLLQGLADNLLTDSLVLEIELDARHPALGAGDLE